METLPVTKIQASARAKRMLLGLDAIAAISDLNSSRVLMVMDVSLANVTSTAQ